MESMKGEGRGKRNKRSQAARKGGRKCKEPSGVILGGAYNRGGACPIGLQGYMTCFSESVLA